MKAVQPTIIDAVVRRYGSLTEPNFAFTEKAVREQPYEHLIASLRGWAEVSETTDLNDDVSFRYVVRRQPQQWALSLSMVGAFGLLVRLDNERAVVTDEVHGKYEARLVDAVAAAGITFLSVETLQEALPLRSVSGASASTTYAALFGDEDLMPWH